MAFNSAEKIVSELVEDLKCSICLEVAKDPLQHEECGKLFCMECIEKYGRDQPCPHCRTQGGKFFPDKRSKRAIQCLPAKCSNANRGCEWEGTAGILENHVATCQFALVPCPKKCKDGNGTVKQFLNKNLDDHLEKDCPNREHKCEHCGKKGKFSNITEIHDQRCLKKILPCSNAECTTRVSREDLESHVREECQHTVIPCKFKNIGCNFTTCRENMLSHEEDDKTHLKMALGAIVKLQDGHMKLQEQLQGKVQTLERSTELVTTFVVTDYQRRLDSSRKFVYPLYSSPSGYRMTVCVMVNGDDYVDMVFSDREYDEDDDSEYNDSDHDNEDEYSSDEGSITEEGHSDDSDESVSDSEIIELHSSKSPSLLPTLFPSPPLPSDEAEHDTEFEDEPTHLSVFVILQEGENDCKLKWPFAGTITITLLNQLENKNHFSRSLTFTSEDNLATKCGNVKWLSNFISHAALVHDPIKKTEYLHGDKLFFRVEVEVASKLKPWLECTVPSFIEPPETYKGSYPGGTGSHGSGV